jgi:hypothetical protein
MDFSPPDWLWVGGPEPCLKGTGELAVAHASTGQCYEGVVVVLPGLRSAPRAGEVPQLHLGPSDIEERPTIAHVSSDAWAIGGIER